MPTSVTLPALGESVTEGTVTRWIKQVGDTVSADEPLLEVSTDKVDTEIPSPASGVLLEIKVAEDETVEVGAELAVIGEEGEQPDSSGGDAGQQADQDQQATPEQQPEQAGQLVESEDDDSEQGEQASQPTEETSEQPEPSPKDADQPSAAPAADDAPPQDGGQQDQSGGGGQGTEVTLPALGESVTEGTVTRWLKQVGDEVAEDEALLEVSTDKVDTEVPSPVAGTVLEIKVAEDETVEVGAVLAVVGSGAPAQSTSQPEQEQPQQQSRQQEQPQQQAAPEPQKQPEAEQPQPQQQQRQQPEPQQRQQPEQPKADEGAAYVTPLVRKLAAQHEVDLGSVTGTGVGGRIRKQDVLAAAEQQKAERARQAEQAQQAQQPQQPAAAQAPAQPTAPTPSPLRGQTVKLSRLRQTIATRMVESLQTSAQLTTVVEVDVTRIARLRNRVKADFAAREGVKLSYLPFFAKAVVEALKAHPSLNCQVDTEKKEATYFDVENLSIAVDTEKGLIVPVIKNAGDLNIAGLAKRIADLAERTRTNKIGPDDLTGGTFTLTNTGSRGALFDTPIINQPQVGILGTGAVVKRAVVVDDEDLGETIAVRYMVYLALTYDHRIVDGADAARFLVDVKTRLEGGAFEGELG